MVYTLSRTPDPPSHPASCPRTRGDHEPVDLLGTALEPLTRAVLTDDGGRVRINLCAVCGLVYWTSEKKVWKGRQLLSPQSTPLNLNLNTNEEDS